MNFRLRYIYIIVSLCGLVGFASAIPVKAQISYRAVKFSNDSIKKSSHFSWSTNLVDWLYFAPNIGVEYDLKSPTEISAPSVFFQLKYRPGKKDFVGEKDYTGNAFSFWSAKAEYRWHFRVSERLEQRKGLVKPTLWLVDRLTPGETIKTDSTTYTSNEKIVQSRIDSTITSYRRRNPAMFAGRYYVGAFAEYADYQFNTKFDLLQRGSLKDGKALIVGLSGGYDFPAFSYNNNHFFQFQVGGSLGLVVSPYDYYKSDSLGVYAPKSATAILPFVTELRFALNYRNYNISRKYWQPDQEVYDRNIALNIADSLHQVQLDSILGTKDIVLTVHSASGDSAFIEQLTMQHVVAAFKQQTGMNLLYENFSESENTKFPIAGKRLDDNHSVVYKVKRRLRGFDDVEETTPYALRFKVELEGRPDADSLLQSFKDSISSYMALNQNVRPTILAEAVNKDSLKSFVSKDTIAAMFSRVWGRQLSPDAIIALRERQEIVIDGERVTEYVQIPFDGVRKKGSYSVDLRFHPQVAMIEENAGRFNIGLDGYAESLDLRNEFANAVKNGLRIKIQRPWVGSETFERPVTSEDILASLETQGLHGFNTSMIHVHEDAQEFGSGYEFNLSFGVTVDSLDFPYSVEDSVGKILAEKAYAEIVNPWYRLGYYRRNSPYAHQEPVVLAMRGEDGLPNVTMEQFLKGVNNVDTLKSQNYAFMAYQVDSLISTVNVRNAKTKKVEKRYFTNVITEEEGEWHRAYAVVRFHRESDKALRIPYKIKVVDEFPIEEDTTSLSTDSAAVSLVGISDSLKIAADTILAAAESTMVAAQDSLQSKVDVEVEKKSQKDKQSRKERKKNKRARKQAAEAVVTNTSNEETTK